MITSVQNSKIKRINALQHKQNTRKKEKLFIVEGSKVINETPGNLIEEIFLSETFCMNNKKYIEELEGKYEVLSDRVFKQISSFTTPQGILAIVKQNPTEFSDLILKDKSLIIALECIQDPGNMGTIIRTADAVNAQAVIISTGSVDIYNSKVVRATMGSIFRVPLIVDVELKEILKKLKENNVNIYAAHLNTNNSYYDMNYKESTCFLIGNEGNGLSKDIANQATDYIKIPILGQAESLNASVAAGVLMYEAIRQRLK